MRYLFLLLVLSGCVTAQTIMKDSQDHYVSCGGSSVGSWTGGIIGYNIQQRMDSDCVREYKEKGYVPVSQ